MYYRFGKAFHFLTVLFFVFVFLYIYSALSDIIAYEVDEQGAWLNSFSKEQFFYIGIITFLVLNVLLVTPAKLIENQTFASFKRLFPKEDKFRDYLLAWIYSFIGIFNISLAILAFFVHSINNQNEISSGSFNVFFYMVPVFFVIWLVTLFWILIQKFKSLKTV